MKVLITTLNARYTHSSLAIAYLRESCRDEKWELECREFTINDRLADIMAQIYRIRPVVLCFSCYIWNVQQILELCSDYKQVDPDCIIVLGGPEVSYDCQNIMRANDAIDIIISGEGEQTLKVLLQHLYSGSDHTHLNGLAWRCGESIILNEPAVLINDLSSIPSPYEGDMSFYKHKMVYYETSRGCPFNCSYCISSTFKGVRYFPLERVKKDLRFLMGNKTKKIKFVDRTFNSNEKRSLELMKFILDEMGENRNTSFHFEVCADLFSDKMLTFLKDIPGGIFDFEIGVQSTCPASLQAVNRTMDWNKLLINIQKIQSYQNIHLHLDLIAGLPYEDYKRFGQSFNDVYQLKPDVIQLGFLKMLKGSQIYIQRDRHEYRYRNLAPYEILSNAYITYDDLIKLHDIEDLIEKYYNTGLMIHTMQYIIDNIYQGNAFALLEEKAWYWRSRDLYEKPHRRDNLYILLSQFIKDNYGEYLPAVIELLKYDYLLNNRVYKVPEQLQSHNPAEAQELLNSILKDNDFLMEYVPEMRGWSLREMKKYAYLEYLKINPLNPLAVQEDNIPIVFLYNQKDHKCYRNIVLDFQ
ncbi:fe-s oxidoreductase [hydrocarbon metagenome]|uniref:Fe-s oxidoreductase n=1 Tax=hydrocarbon metagenome TaxID=938273 RepID=A0A0W8E6J7_9ZZZZ